MAGDMTYLQLFFSIAHTTNSSLNLDDTLQAILGGIQEALGAHGVVIRLLNPDADALNVVASRGVNQAFLEQVEPRIVPASVNEKMLAGEMVQIGDLRRVAPQRPCPGFRCSSR